MSGELPFEWFVLILRLVLIFLFKEERAATPPAAPRGAKGKTGRWVLLGLPGGAGW